MMHYEHLIITYILKHTSKWIYLYFCLCMMAKDKGESENRVPTAVAALKEEDENMDLDRPTRPLSFPKTARCGAKAPQKPS